MVPEINLLPKLERKKGGSKVLLFLLAIGFILLLSFMIMQFFSLSKQVQSLQDEQQALEVQKGELEMEVASLEKTDQIDLPTSVRVIESKTYPVSPLVKEIHKYLPAEGYLRSFTFAEKSIQFNIDTETITEIATYVGDLDGSAYFADIKVENISTFNPLVNELENENEENLDAFNEVDRFSNDFTVTIDPGYLSTGGVAR